MSLTTEEIIGGMYRAHRAGQPFAALVANPQFANLPQEQKKEVLAGLRQRMGGETSSPVNALTSIIKGTAGGAVAGLPLGVAVPIALEMSDSGASKRSVLTALKMAAQNKNVKMLVGTGMALGAVGGLLNTALSLRQSAKDHTRMQEDLEAASQGGEALAAASFGAIGGRTAPRHVNMDPVIKTFRDTSMPYVMASARFGHAGQMVDDAPDYQGIVTNVHEKIQRGIPMNPERLAEIAAQARKTQGHVNALHSIVVNSPRELNIEPSTAQATADEFAQMHANTGASIENLNTLEQFARQVRDMKRGAQ